MLIVDSQLHLWGPDTPSRPWPAGRAAEAQKPYPIPQEALLFQMDLAGVARAVLVPPSWEGDRNDLALAAAQKYPDRFCVMGRFKLEDSNAKDLVATWKSQPGMQGMRFTFHNEHNRHLLLNGLADWLWPLAEKHGIPLMIFAPRLMPHIGKIAERHPSLRIVIDHAGLHTYDRTPKVPDDFVEVGALGKFPNVAVKASGLPSLSAEPYPFRDLHDAVRYLFDAFGPHRTFWGTDLTRMPCSYRECIDMFTKELPWLSGSDLELVMGRGVCNWLGWKV